LKIAPLPSERRMATVIPAWRSRHRRMVVDRPIARRPSSEQAACRRDGAKQTGPVGV
jgi:hypothetical protein